MCGDVDNLKSSRIDPKVNDEFLQWIKDTFGQLGEVKMTQGLLHDYLGMTLDYSVPGQVSINTSHYQYFQHTSPVVCPCFYSLCGSNLGLFGCYIKEILVSFHCQQFLFDC